MAQSKAKTQRLATIVIIAFNIVGMGLIFYDLANNISYEIQNKAQSESVVQEVLTSPGEGN
jgi:thiamine kinase-like enzyme